MRALIVALFVVNLGFAAWAAGWLGSSGGDRDPQRLERQVHPERVRVVRQPGATGLRSAPPAPSDAADPSHSAGASGSPPPISPGATVAMAPTSAGASHLPPPPAEAANCFEVGPFTPNEVVAAEAALVRASLPAGSWTDLKVDVPGEFIIYAGRYPDREGLERKVAEVKRLKLYYEEIRDPNLAPGLVLGRFATRAEAEASQLQLQQQSVRNTRVIAIAAPMTTHVLRVERADAGLQSQLTAIRAPALGAGFVRCGLAAAASPGR